MIDINSHKFYLVNILKDIYKDIDLATSLGFKGGTALMFFYDLPRFSVDLDFNLLNSEKEDQVHSKVKDILLQYGSIYDEAKKFYGPVLVLDYGKGERKLKVEISTRKFDNHYELKNLLGINMQVMAISDMFAHKLCALLDRNTIANRDIFDLWFFMNRRTELNKEIVESRMKMSLKDYLSQCIKKLETKNNSKLLQGMGELMDEEMKAFVRTELLDETIQLLKIYREYPIIKTFED